MASDHQQFCLRWHSFQSNLLSSLPQFLNDDDLTDVTLSAGGRQVRAHRVVLSASSLYFKEIFKELLPLQHPVIVLPGMNYRDLCALLTFIYSGEVNIYQDQLPGLLSMADTLHVRGLAEVQSEDKRFADLTAKKNSNCPPIKRARSTTSPTPPNQGLVQSPTTEDNRLKCAPSQIEPKNMKDFNENNTNQFSTVEMLKNFYGLPFDDSTLKMMNAKSAKNVGGRVKQKKTGFGPITPGPYTPNLALNIDLFNLPKPLDAYRFNGDLMEAQDLRQVRDADHVNAHAPHASECDTSPGPAAGTCDFTPEPDIHASSSLCNEVKPGMYSPESDDSGGGGMNDCYRDMSSALRNLAVQSKGFATCPVCKKQLSNQYNLRVHLETHQNVQYYCTVCSHVSRSRDALRKHVSYRHPIEGKEVGKKAKDGCKKVARGDEGPVDMLDPNDSGAISLAQLSVVGP